MLAVAPEVWGFTGLLAGRAYLLADADGLTIVDAGLAQASERILRQLRAAGHAPSAVRRLLITHGHPDHIGGLPALQRATGARVIAATAERAVIEGRAPLVRPPADRLSWPARLLAGGDPPTMPGTPVDEEVGEGAVLGQVLGGLQVLATPGHSPGHLSFWEPRRRLLFCGDVLMNLAGLRLPFAAFTVDMDENRRSIARLARLEPEIILFGHGPPLRREATRLLRAFAERVA